ncbi:hypothetical protein [Cellulomonas phragmiteti]|uniref:TM2 domain-containing protein n=1 Tax=Cellulomonas phragmiteti TaxID=478780 RepID=A0ABQ4DPB9_9CELL|nr:hypothetical protein [Cellulomonas phragmiteti]GIG41193.1 hypothetical protein Cph01nite_29550 [Cellulomonas phragmiteti]
MTSSHLDLDEDLERPVVTRVPPRHRPPAGASPAAAVRYPVGPVPDVEDAVPAVSGPRARWAGPARWLGARRPVTWARDRLRSRRPGTRSPARPTRQPLPRSRVLAGLLGVVLGGLGLHALYLGHRRRGLWMLGTTLVLGPLTLGVAALLMGVWGLVEGLLVLGSRRGRFTRDAWGRPLLG